MNANRITLTRPDDWHLHLRDGAILATALPATARCFGRAIVMPNLQPPVATVAQARAYRDRITAALPAGADFEPLMTLYLTEATSPGEIAEAARSDLVHGVKYYPAGATTHSESGVTDLRNAYPALEAMQEHGVPLLMHGEVTDPSVDVFDREAVFIERQLAPLLQDFPALRVVLEHVTTRDGVDFVRAAPPTVGATVTVHHLLLNRNALFDGGLRPHHYCRPLIKRETHRQALVEAATSGHPRFFAGTDSAPHHRHAKESACGCAGVYSAPAALELYAEVFDRMGAIDRLEAFMSFHGADFYGLPRNRGRVVLERADWTMPEEIATAEAPIVPLRAGEKVAWRVRAGLEDRQAS